MSVAIVRVEQLNQCIDAVCSLWNAFNGEYISSLCLLDRLVQSNSLLVHAVEDNSEVVGFATGTPHHTPLHDTRVFQLWAIFVKPSLRRCGIGSRLLRAIEDEAQKLECSYIFAAVHSRREIINFYSLLGFRAHASYLHRELL